MDPATSECLDRVGLKATSPYKNGDEFRAILVKMIADNLGLQYKHSDFDEFEHDMHAYLTYLKVDNEACLNQMTDADSWTENIIPSSLEGYSHIDTETLTRITAPVKRMLREIAVASLSVSQVSRYLSDEVSFSALFAWSTALHDEFLLFQPATDIFGNKLANQHSCD